MTTYDKLMLEVKVIQGGSAYLNHYTFDLDGFAEAHDALLAKGCKPIPPLTAAEGFLPFIFLGTWPLRHMTPCVGDNSLSDV